MNILVACEESQAVTIELRKLGHNAFSCDIIECSGGHPEWHIMQDVLPLLNGYCHFKTCDGLSHYLDSKWDMILAFPPCTYLTVAGNRYFNVERYGDKALERIQKSKKAAEFFMNFVNADCQKIAIENPVGRMNTLYRKPDQIINPFNFGHPVSKKTCLWLKGLAPLKHTKEVKPEIIHSKGKSGGYSGPSWYVTDEEGKILSWKDPRTARARSKTYEGIAKAMAEQWAGIAEHKRKLKILELFAGTRSIGKAFEAKGHEVFSVEWDKDFENIDLYADIGKITAEEILEKFGKPDVIWASPDCATFSVAAISAHRRKNKETGNLDPVSDYAKFCDEVDQHVLKLIDQLKPKLFFIENPRGGMRKMSWMQGIPRYTVTYCQYGERRMKPTDIWTNHPNPQFKPPCKNGDSCHDAAPRGSQTGTQALKTAREKGIIPKALCHHIVDICEKYIKPREEKEMELKIKPYNPAEQILFNYEELKAGIQEKAAMYATLVYTDETIKEAKADKANLNKLKKALNDERIKREKEYMQPFNDFKAKINELIRIIDEPVGIIDKQIKEAEEAKKREKTEKIKELFEKTVFPDWLKLEQIWEARWLNATVSLKSIEGALKSKCELIENDLATLSQLPEYGFEAIETYKSSLDIRNAMNEAHRLSEMARRKAEAERIAAERKAEAERLAQERKAMEEAKKTEEIPCSPYGADHGTKKPYEAPVATVVPTANIDGQNATVESIPVEVPRRMWVSFQAYLTTEDAYALGDFFKARNIEFKPV